MYAEFLTLLTQTPRLTKCNTKSMTYEYIYTYLKKNDTKELRNLITKSTFIFRVQLFSIKILKGNRNHYEHNKILTTKEQCKRES